MCDSVRLLFFFFFLLLHCSCAATLSSGSCSYSSSRCSFAFTYPAGLCRACPVSSVDSSARVRVFYVDTP